MTHSPLANGIQLTSDHDSRNGQRVRYFIVHHAATTSLAAILSLFAPGGREVSANYALGSDGTLVLAVDEDFSAWTSASWYDDAAITIEVANSVAGGSWPVSDAAFEKLAALIADVATRYGFPITDDTVLTHQELYRRFGESYATACPGDLQRRKAELISRARTIQAGTPQPAPEKLEFDDMSFLPFCIQNKEPNAKPTPGLAIYSNGHTEAISKEQWDAFNFAGAKMYETKISGHFAFFLDQAAKLRASTGAK